MQLDRLVEVYFNAEIARAYLPDLLRGLGMTLKLSVGVILAGLPLGLGLALVRLVSPRIVVEIIRLWVDCLRAIPPLVLVMLAYFGLPSVGIPLTGFWVMWLTLTMILTAFAEEVFWAGITAIPRGQREAARSTGLTGAQTMRYVILPQAMKMCVPPLANRTLAITKNTALATAIGMPELLTEAQIAQAVSGNATPLVLAAVGYLLIFAPIMAFAGHLERRMNWGLAK